MLVQCISQRPGHADNVYGTGPWDFAEIKDVPNDVARQMIKHPDVYVEPVSADGVEVKKVTIAGTTQTDAEIKDQAFYDKLSIMSKDQAKSFIESTYNVKVDARKYPTETAMRDYARMLYDQFGAA